MFRKRAAKKKHTERIKWRGQEVTRIEAFSDAVFAFAITLLIVSLEVPHDYNELIENLRFFLPFGICFTIIFAIWYQQNMFFRRYGLHDFKTIVLNGCLLFFVLVYMFPLKFVIGSMFSKKFHFENMQQFATLFSLYCGGFALFYFLFSLMYFNAYSQREHMRLTDVESFQTQSHAYSNLLVACVATIAVMIVLVSNTLAGFAGLAFGLLWPGIYILDKKRSKRFTQRFGDIPHIPPQEHMHAHTIHDEEKN